MVVNVVVMVNICMLFNIINFSKPPTYIYTVKMTESDHKKAYRYIRCYVLPVIN
jgi:hypothetical protein